MELPLLIPVEKVLDDRGYFHKILDQGILSDNGIKDFQAFEMFSTLTKKNGIRGMHIQKSPHQIRKLVWVSAGEILDVVVNVGSREVYTFEMNANSDFILFVPKNFAHGFQALTMDTTVNYLTDAPYNRESDTGFNAFSFGFEWPRPTSVISIRDQNLRHFEEFHAEY
jgi:dTDP-4-dehydrorhamnose 3,5-epimerase